MTGVIGRHRTSRDPVSYPDRVTDAPDDDQPPFVGIVVPTMGERPRFISESISSIRAAGQAHITVVKPRTADLDGPLVASIDQIVDDPGRGLAAAINSGLNAMPETVRYVSWLGDDDRLAPDSISRIVGELDRTGASVVYGRCRYIDSEGSLLWLNRSGRYASPLMRVGPQLVPQPGSLMRRVDDAVRDEPCRWWTCVPPVESLILRRPVTED